MGNFKDWLGGLIAAIATALSASTGATMADPQVFNIWSPEGRQKMLVVAVMAAWPAVLAYLKQRPLPGVVEPLTTTTSTETTMRQTAPGTVVVQKVEQVKVTPTPQPDHDVVD